MKKRTITVTLSVVAAACLAVGIVKVEIESNSTEWQYGYRYVPIYKSQQYLMFHTERITFKGDQAIRDGRVYVDYPSDSTLDTMAVDVLSNWHLSTNTVSKNRFKSGFRAGW